MENEKIEVHVDLELKEIVPGYLENRWKDIQSIQEALGKKNFEMIKSLAHSMKGSGGGYGFDGITEIGAAMEMAAVARDVKLIEAEVSRLKDYLKRVEIVYDGEVNRDAA